MIPHIVSLGVNCEIRTMIKEWISALDKGGISSEYYEKIRGNHFFDWNITNPWSVVDCINNNFVGIFQLDNLIAREETDGSLNYIDGLIYNIRFHHTFSRVNNITAQEIIKEEHASLVPKINYLVGKFRALAKLDEPIYFVRRGAETESETAAIIDALRKFREGRPFCYMHVCFSMVEWNQLEKPPEYIPFHMPQGAWLLSNWMPIFEEIMALEKIHA